MHDPSYNYFLLVHIVYLQHLIVNGKEFLQESYKMSSLINKYLHFVRLHGWALLCRKNIQLFATYVFYGLEQVFGVVEPRSFALRTQDDNLGLPSTNASARFSIVLLYRGHRPAESTYVDFRHNFLFSYYFNLFLSRNLHASSCAVFACGLNQNPR